MIKIDSKFDIVSNRMKLHRIYGAGFIALFENRYGVMERKTIFLSSFPGRFALRTGLGLGWLCHSHCQCVVSHSECGGWTVTGAELVRHVWCR